VPEQADAYVGTAASGQFDMKEVQSLFLRADEGCASVPVTALVSSDGISAQLIHSNANRAQLSALHVLRSNRPNNNGLAETAAALATARKMDEARIMK
jgi:hypothetical protein